MGPDLAAVKFHLPTMGQDLVVVVAISHFPIMDPVVDFNRIARNVMGKYYKQANKSQRDKFFGVFRSTLLKTYTDTFVEFKDEEIRVLPKKEDSKK